MSAFIETGTPNVPSTLEILAVNSTQFVMVSLLLVLLALGIVGRLLNKRRLTIWQQFARQHGYQFDLSATGPIIRGTDFLLNFPDQSSDTESLGAQESRMALTWTSSRPPQDLHIQNAQTLVGNLQKGLESERFLTNDDEFDAEFIVNCEEETPTQNWLNEHRRAILKQLVQDHPEKLIEITTDQVALQTSTAISHIEQLNSMRESLLKAYAALQ